MKREKFNNFIQRRKNISDCSLCVIFCFISCFSMDFTHMTKLLSSQVNPQQKLLFSGFQTQNSLTLSQKHSKKYKISNCIKIINIFLSLFLILIPIIILMSKKPGSSKASLIITDQIKQKQQLKTMKKMDVTTLKTDIHSLRQQLKHLVTQKILLQKKMQSSTQQYMNQSYELEKVSKRQEEELVELEDKLKILRNTFSEAEVKRKTQMAIEVQQLSGKREGEREEVRKVMEALSRKVEHLKKFKERQPLYLSTLAQLQQRLAYVTASHTKDMDKLKHHFQQTRQQISTLTSQQITSIQSTQINKIRQKLTKEQQIKKENEIMMQEIQLCEEEKVIVENECKLLGEEMRKGKEDGSVGMLGEQATQTYERSLRVIKLQGKIAKLKGFLNEEVKRLQEQTLKTDKSYDQKQKTTLQRIQKTKTSLTLKQRDYTKIKACSQMVLNQRSNLQSYLLQVFYQNPSLSSRQPTNVNEILRKLFIKINSKKTPVSYKNYMNFDLGRSGVSYLEGQQGLVEEAGRE